MGEVKDNRQDGCLVAILIIIGGLLVLWGIDVLFPDLDIYIGIIIIIVMIVVGILSVK